MGVFSDGLVGAKRDLQRQGLQQRVAGLAHHPLAPGSRINGAEIQPKISLKHGRMAQK